jgi:hypothetical protein
MGWMPWFRELVKNSGGFLGAATAALSSVVEANAIVINPKPLFEISPWHYI